ncbi:hypothetical protein ON003_11055 [Janibacter hoylei]|uniref:hypothetical protein n=1 Tax=Janibacter hoylei TaxID=364298 RepID=UPI002237D0E2|nr:hypothetical protein [Janibacter hoylei]MCW4602084.1 hypothetical protein [Janibacter hoylei]
MPTPKKPRETFADLVQKPTWSQTKASHRGRNASRAGTFNQAGEFFDPDGRELRLVTEEATEAEAQACVDAGASVVAESCGCGGTEAGCTPRWITTDQLHGLRRGAEPCFTGEHEAPSWIDVWSNDHGTVVFAHGDVSWGSALP